MKNKIVLFTLISFFALSFFVPAQKALAYGYDTHALLTKEAINLYNRNAENKIPENIERFAIDGSRQEDNAPRWLNHFYDPVYDRPLRFDPAIDPQLALLVNVMGRAVTAKDWAQSEVYQGAFPYNIASLIDIKPLRVGSILMGTEQAKLGSLQSEADFAWQRAIRLYINGDKEKAMFTLGHVLHLMEDMSVPDHTRNDAHIEDSPYEKYASQYDIANPDGELAEELKDKKLFVSESLDSYFNSLAEYSNKNFYSKDTIGVQSGYAFPQPDHEQIEGKYIYGIKIIDGHLCKIFFKEGQGIFNELATFNANISGDSDERVLSDYWSLLSVKSVEYSAGVIDLFFREVEKYENNPREIPGDRPLFAMIGEAVGDFLSGAGSAIKGAALDMIGEGNNETIGEVSLNSGDSNSDQSNNSASPEETENKKKVVPVVSASKKEVKQGQVIHEKGNKFSPGSPVVLYFYLPTGRTVSVNITAGPDGKFDNRYVMPEDAVLGRYFYYAEDVKTGTVSEKIFFDVIKGNEKVAPKPPVNTEEKSNDEKDDEKENKNSNELEKGDAVKELQTDPKPACSYGLDGASSVRAIVINEIAWMGGTSNSSDEWVELKNVSGSSIDVSGWEIMNEDGDVAVKIKQGSVIPAGSFFLLERTDDDSVPGIDADLIYSGILSNGGEELKIFDSNCLVVDSLSAGTWPAGDAPSRRTMERALSGGWQTSYYPGGTPKKENSSGYVAPAAQTFSSGGYSPVSLCSKKDGEPSKKIIINEVAWSGDSLSASHEWIEFFNPSSEPVSLSGWQLLDESEDLKIIFGSGKSAPAGGYVLVEKNPGGLFEDVLSLAVFTGWINNSDESLYLYDSSCALVDKVVETGKNWKNIGGSSTPEHRTAERDEIGWHTYFGVGIDNIFGTPGVLNSARVEESEGGNNEEDDDDENDVEGEEDNKGEEEGNDADNAVVGVLISEIMPGTTEAPENEFIELYNPASGEIALDGWSVKVKTNEESDPRSLISVESGKFAGKKIKPKGFFLIGGQSYSGKNAADVSYSEDQMSEAGELIYLYDNEGNIVDEIGHSVITGGKSRERKARHDDICASPSGDGEFLGNGCDGSGDESFEEREKPHPQNSESPIEPREMPVIPFSEEEFIISYDPQTVSIGFSWPEPPEDLEVFIVEKESNEKVSGNNYRIYEVNKPYTFIIRVSDKEGLLSDDSFKKAINVPGFAEIGFYSGIKQDFDNAAHAGPIIELKYASRPFLPQELVLSEMAPPGPNYKAVVFYLNGDVPKSEFLEYELPPAGEPVMNIHYKSYMGAYDSRRSLLVPDAENHFLEGSSFDKSLSEDYLDEGDSNIVLSASGPSGETGFTASDCLSVAYYGFYRGYVGLPSSETYKLIAVDGKKYCFSGEYKSLPPALPSNIRVNNQDGVDHILWDATDSDSPDRLITYEISTDGENWLPAHANMIMPDSETIYIRAIDDFGVKSAPAMKNFTAPELEQ